MSRWGSNQSKITEVLQSIFHTFPFIPTQPTQRVENLDAHWYISFGFHQYLKIYEFIAKIQKLENVMKVETCSFFWLGQLSQLTNSPTGHSVQQLLPSRSKPSTPCHMPGILYLAYLTQSFYLHSHCRHVSSQPFKMKCCQTLSNKDLAALLK